MKNKAHKSSVGVFIPVSSKFKKTETDISLEEVFKRFGKNTKHLPITDTRILRRLLRNPALIPKDVNKTGNYFLVLKKFKKNKKPVFIKALNVNAKLQETELFPDDRYFAGDYVLCKN